MPTMRRAVRVSNSRATPCIASASPISADVIAVLALHLEQNDSAEDERDPGQHLVRDAEQRPQGVYSAHRVDYALMEEIAPGGDGET